MCDEKRDFRTNRTLTERVEVAEEWIRTIDPDYGRQTLRDEGDLDTLASGGVVSREEAQRAWNRIPTERYGLAPGQDPRTKNYDQSNGAEDLTVAVTAFEEVINRIQASTDRVFRQVGKLEDIGNRILGTLPEGAMAGADNRREPGGTLEHVFIVLDYLDNGLTRLEAAALRLERI